eukprot:s65_g6.t1
MGRLALADPALQYAVEVLGFEPLHLGHANSAIARLSQQRWRQGEALLAALRPAALQAIGYNAASSACGAATQGAEGWRRARRLLAQLAEDELRATAETISRNAVLTSLGDAWAKALQLLQSTGAVRLQTSLISYNSTACHWRGSLRWLTWMGEHEMEPDQVSLSSSLTTWHGTWPRATALLSARFVPNQARRSG